MNPIDQFILQVVGLVIKKFFTDYKRSITIIIAILIVILSYFFISNTAFFKYNKPLNVVSSLVPEISSEGKVKENAFMSKLMPFVMPYSTDVKPKVTNKFLGVKLFSEKNNVFDALGYPSSVEFKTFNFNDSRISSHNKAMSKFFGGILVTATEEEINSRPNGIFDFSEWNYDLIKTLYLRVSFDEKKKVSSILCQKALHAELDNRWENLRKICFINGISLSDSKIHVLNTLGKPSNNLDFNFEYVRLNMEVSFDEDMVNSILIRNPY